MGGEWKCGTHLRACVSARARHCVCVCVHARAGVMCAMLRKGRGRRKGAQEVGVGSGRDGPPRC